MAIGTGVLVTIVAVGALLLLDEAAPPWRGLAKMAASTGFVAVAIAGGAAGSRYGRILLVGLALAWVGDVVLVAETRAAFLAGLISFALAHLAYIAAFAERGLDRAVGSTALTVAAGVGVLVWRWLRPHLDRATTAPVAGYVIVISTMVAAAIGTTGAHLDLRIAAGAAAFYLSDLFVARQTFVDPGRVNRLWGLPLYYGGQLLLAASAGG